MTTNNDITSYLTFYHEACDSVTNQDTERDDTETTLKKQTIQTRTEPCNCGCQGSDPWHKKYYTRTVTNISPCGRYGESRLPFATGTAKVKRNAHVEVTRLSTGEMETGRAWLTHVWDVIDYDQK